MTAASPNATEDGNFQTSPVRCPTNSQSLQTPEHPAVEAPTLRAFENDNWMRSKEARTVRIMSEFLETQGRLKEENVLGSILFFGSARLRSERQWKLDVEQLQCRQNKTPEDMEALLRLERQKGMVPWWQKTRELAKLITAWAATEEAKIACYRILGRDKSEEANWSPPGLVITTGGGPGLMEAANRGAAEVPEGRSMGMGITLPFEDHLNCYVTSKLSFKYHYFFTRKFWMVYMALGCVATPGGLGTLDELMELLTLRSTGRFKINIPIILFGKDFWKNTVNFEYLRDNGMISDQDYKMLFWTDEPEEAMAYIRKMLMQPSATE